MKKRVKRLRNILWSLLLSAAIVIESTAGSAVVYATESAGEQTVLGVTEVTEEPGESEEPGEGQENPDGNEDKNNNEDPDADDEDKDDDNEDDTGESGDNQEDSDKNESDENDDDNSEKSEGDENDSDENEEETDESDEEVDEEEVDSEEEKELEDPAAALVSRNSSFFKELEALRAESNDWAKATGHIANGYRDVDYDVEDLSEPIGISDDSFVPANRATVPSKYDAREHGQVSSVKNQSPWGTCWSFSAVGSAENAYKMMHNGDEVNLSETHLVNFFYNGNTGANVSGPDGGLSGDKTTALTDDPVEQGGNSMFTTFALASWTGVANEAINPSLVYPSNQSSAVLPSISSGLAYTDEMHLENAYWINLSDKSNVKKAIMEYGAVGVSYYYDEWFDSDYYKAFCDRTYNGSAIYYDPIDEGSNHAVAIVGWDDSFDRNNFKNTYFNYMLNQNNYKYVLPSKNGAWLIKNSWGTGVGDGGYFWISYEDASIINQIAFAFDYESADNYDHNYQYDGSNGLYNMGYSDGITAAAVYTAKGSEVIAAVGVGFADTSTNYTVKIYKNVENENNPESGELAATVTGKTSFEGFYTIPIEDAVFVEPGETFGIVVTAKKSGGAHLFVDRSYMNGNWISFTANTTNDKTYVKNGSAWYNAGTRWDCTFRIKAYTRDFDMSDLDNAKNGDKVLRDDMLEEIAPQVYNGATVEPELNIVFNGTLLQKDRDYTVTYENDSNKKAGTATVIIDGTGEYTGQIKTKFTITKKTITADMIADVAGWTYDGTEHSHDILVTNDGNLMTEGTDYTVKYNKTPLNAGTYTATVTAKGSNYSGSAKKTFTIEKLDLGKATVSLEYDQAAYTGQDIKPTVAVTVGTEDNTKTIAPANYTVKYQNNKAAGEAKVTITGKSNCQGSVTKTFVINPKSLGQDETLQEGISVVVKSVTYSGAKLRPGVTVKDGKTTLKLNKDYTISEDAYANNTHATTEDSRATVTIEGIGNYSGTIRKDFLIAKQSVAKNKIKVEPVYAETGSSCIVTVNGKQINASDGYDLRIYKAGTEDPVAENKLENNEKYDITVTLNKNYKDITVPFKKVVCKKSVGGLDIELKNPGDASVTYNGKAIKPAIIVKEKDENIPLTTKAYSVSYANNVNAGAATITITGKGDYSGTKSINFTIMPQEVDDEKLVITVPTKTYTGSPIAPAITVKANNKKLKAGTDYDNVIYSNNTDASGNTNKPEVKITLKNYKIKDVGFNKVQEFKINPAKITSVKLGTSYFKGVDVPVQPELTVTAGKIALKQNEYVVSWENNSNVTSKAKVVITSNSTNFTGGKTVTFKITKEPLSKATVAGIPNQEVYKGTIIEPKVTLANIGGEIIDSGQYTVSYKNNIKSGTASVTIKANTDSLYSGSVTKKFKITKADLAEMLTVDASKLSAKTYTGSKLTYTADEIKAAATPSVATDSPYKISYKDNVNAGTATVILTGTGNYAGTYEIPFTINRCDINSVDVKITLENKSVSLAKSNPALAKIKQAVYGKLKLKAKKDYTLSYVNSNKTGVAAVKITGIGNYQGTKQMTYVIVK